MIFFKGDVSIAIVTMHSYNYDQILITEYASPHHLYIAVFLFIDMLK